ncbi:MAG: hypothetical protein HY852_26350 [Bradyrhizobium sp.]|nr:hypothetical protein [Bradyrhizobium sp.]MBI5265330.1 hypothetical protein [Bradyrhizobium sp.]
MTMTLIWTGIALWLGLNAAIAARCIYVALPARNDRSSARVVHLQRRRA